MDDILEFVLELILEGGIEISSNRKVSKWIRYPMLFIISVFFLAIILLIIWLSMSVYKESIWLSIALIILDIAILKGYINWFKKIYIEKIDSEGK